MRTLMVLVALVLTGCGFEPMSEVRISSEFSFEEQDAIVAAALEWEKALGVNLGATICQDDCTVVRGTECGERVNGYANLNHKAEAIVVICPEGMRNMSKLKQTALHELGHALAGRDDHIDAGNIMASNRSNAERAGFALTMADVNYVTGQ